MFIRNVCSRKIKKICSKRKNWLINSTVIFVCGLLLIIVVSRQNNQDEPILRVQFQGNEDKRVAFETTSELMYTRKQGKQKTIQSVQTLKQFQYVVESLTTTSQNKRTTHSKQQTVQDSVFDQQSIQELMFDQKLELKEDVFQNITKDGKYLVYNAYIDGPREDLVFAIGLSISRNPKIELFCLFWDSNMRVISNETKVSIKILPIHVVERYKNAIFTCPIPAKNAVALTIRSKGTSANKTPNLLKIKVSPSLNRTFTICLRPIHFKKTAAFDIVEWVEYYRIMGVDHFVIYNFTSDPLTDKVLRYYENAGLMDVVQWHVPEHVIPKKHYYNLVKYNELHAVGQFAMLNDFLYRVFWSTKFIINVDLDEFIVPLNGSTNFNQLLSKFPTAACQYLIRNSLIPLNQNQTREQFPNKEIATKYHLKTVLYRKRKDYVFGEKWKTKYIAHPRCSRILWLHYVLENRISDLVMKKHLVSEKTALVFHYRLPFEGLIFQRLQRGKREKEDTRFQPFVDDLINNVSAVWDVIGPPSNFTK